MPPAANICFICGTSYSKQALFCPKDGAPLGSQDRTSEPDLYLGLEIAGQFRIEKLIGVGAMGRVYRAYQQSVERFVAVKILHRELSKDEDVVARFLQEAKIVSRVMHTNVVQA